MNINFLKNSLKVIGITTAIALILLIIMNFISYSSGDPDKMLTPLAYSVLLLSAFICGLLAAKYNNENKIVSSAISGAVYLFVIFLFSLVLRGSAESFTPGWLTFVMYIAAMGCVMLGSLAGRPRKISANKTRKNIKNKYSQNLRRKVQ